MKIGMRIASVLIGVLCYAPLSYGQETRIGNFPPVDLIETELERGVSTTEDVLRVLGRPAGKGGYLAIMDRVPRDVWYYHDINSSVIDTKDGVIRMHVHTQVLLVFFSRDRLDGYKWFTASGAARGQAGRGSQGGGQ